MKITLNPKIGTLNGRSSNKQVGFKCSIAPPLKATASQGSPGGPGGKPAGVTGGASGSGGKFPWWILILIAAGIGTYGYVRHNKKKKEETLPESIQKSK